MKQASVAKCPKVPPIYKIAQICLVYIWRKPQTIKLWCRVSDTRVAYKNCRMSSGTELIVSDSEFCLIFRAYYQKKGRKGEGITFPWVPGTGLSAFDLWSHLSLVLWPVLPTYVYCWRNWGSEILAQIDTKYVVVTEFEFIAIWLQSPCSFQYIKRLLESEGSLQHEHENLMMFKRRIKGRIVKC